MADRSIKIRKIKETKSRVTIHLVSVNRKMHVPKKDYKKRVETGLYEVVSDLTQEAEASE